jgi:hypothetical protein
MRQNRTSFLFLPLLLMAVGGCDSLRATTVGPRSCVGLNTTECPGTLDVLTGDPGTLLDQSVMPVWRYNSQTQLEEVIAEIRTAVFQEQPNTDGVFNPLTFYFQVHTREVPLNIQSVIIGPATIGKIKFPVEVGVRTEAFAGFSASTLAPNDLQTMAVSWEADFLAGGVPANTDSAIVALHTTNTGWNRGGIAQIDTIPHGTSGGEGYLTDSRYGAIDLPDTAPEPATVWLLGSGFLLLVGARVRKTKKGPPSREA